MNRTITSDGYFIGNEEDIVWVAIYEWDKIRPYYRFKTMHVYEAERRGFDFYKMLENCKKEIDRLKSV